MAKSKLAVGLDIGSSSVKLVQLREKKGGYTLQAFGVSKLPPDTIVDGAIIDAGIFASIGSAAAGVPSRPGAGPGACACRSRGRGPRSGRPASRRSPTCRSGGSASRRSSSASCGCSCLAGGTCGTGKLLFRSLFAVRRNWIQPDQLGDSHQAISLAAQVVDQGGQSFAGVPSAAVGMHQHDRPVLYTLFDQPQDVFGVIIRHRVGSVGIPLNSVQT